MVHNTYGWFMSHTWMRRATCVHKSCHTYESGMSRIWMNHVTHVNKARHTYIMNESCLIWMRQISHIDESCFTRMSHVSHTNKYKLVLQHVWMNHTTCRNEAWHSYFTKISLSQPKKFRLCWQQRGRRAERMNVKYDWQVSSGNTGWAQRSAD